MEAKDVIAEVTTPTNWISFMVTIPKKNGKSHICLNPKDLSCAILSGNYQLPTVKDIATRLHWSKVFTVMDVWNGFGHVNLDEESSYLSTFQMPFSHFAWSAYPLAFHQLQRYFEGECMSPLKAVVADDFIVVGYGGTFKEATKDHNKTLLEYLKWCRERNVCLNPENLKLWQLQVLFIRHIAMDQWLEVDPAKVQATVEMLPPTDEQGVQRLLRLAPYLPKFLPQSLRSLSH